MDSDIREFAGKLIDSGFLQNRKIRRIVSHTFIESPIISKTGDGCYYRPHQDSPDNGQYSTTLFLSKPEDYDGGYLRIYDGYEIKDYKLDPGYAVTYSTSCIHEVSTVTRGERMVSCFWTKSPFTEQSYEKDIYYMLFDLLNTLESNESKIFSLEDALADPHFLLETICNKYQKMIMRNIT